MLLNVLDGLFLTAKDSTFTPSCRVLNLNYFPPDCKIVDLSFMILVRLSWTSENLVQF